LYQRVPHHPFPAFPFTDLTQLGEGHQQAHLDLLPDVVVFTRLGAEGQSGIVLRRVRDAAARCTLFWLEERQIKVRMRLCCRATTQTATGVTGFNIPTINRRGAAL